MRLDSSREIVICILIRVYCSLQLDYYQHHHPPSLNFCPYGLEDGRMDIKYYMEADSLVLPATQPEEEERRINLTLFLYEIITFIRNIIHCFKLRGIKLLFITINNCLPSKTVAEFYSSSWAAPSLPLLLHSVIE